VQEERKVLWGGGRMKVKVGSSWSVMKKVFQCNVKKVFQEGKWKGKVLQGIERKERSVSVAGRWCDFPRSCSHLVVVELSSLVVVLRSSCWPSVGLENHTAAGDSVAEPLHWHSEITCEPGVACCHRLFPPWSTRRFSPTSVAFHSRFVALGFFECARFGVFFRAH